MSNSSSQRVSTWTGRVLSILIALFLLVDAIMKVLETVPAMKGSVELGWPENSVQGIGFVLLLCTVLYMLPRTAFFGAILLTGYLGGAIAIMIVADKPGNSFLFPLVFGIITWIGLYLRNSEIRQFVPWQRK